MSARAARPTAPERPRAERSAASWSWAAVELEPAAAPTASGLQAVRSAGSWLWQAGRPAAAVPSRGRSRACGRDPACRVGRGAVAPLRQYLEQRVAFAARPPGRRCARALPQARWPARSPACPPGPASPRGPACPGAGVGLHWLRPGRRVVFVAPWPVAQGLLTAQPRRVPALAWRGLPIRRLACPAGRRRAAARRVRRLARRARGGNALRLPLPRPRQRQPRLRQRRPQWQRLPRQTRPQLCQRQPLPRQMRPRPR
jgi:hypothetical protein